MRTTINIDNKLINEASALTGLHEKTALVKEGLKALIQQESAKRLACLGRSEPQLQDTPRRRPEK